jgi:hypothetical protein
MFHYALATTCVLTLVLLPTRTTATVLLPGQTLDLSTVSTTTIDASFATASTGATFNSQTSSNGQTTITYYGFFGSAWKNIDANPADGKSIIYTFIGNLVIDPLPNTTILQAIPPANAAISITGFGDQPIDVAENTTFFSQFTFIHSLSRSADGNTLTLSGFQDFATASFAARVAPQLVLTLPNAGDIATTSAILDLQNGTSLTTDAFAALPEPTTLVLLPLALTALALRRHR